VHCIQIPQGGCADIPDTFHFLSELGAHEGAVVVAGGEIDGDPSPLPVRESAVHPVQGV
jgi:hypothetical protein